MRQGGGGAAARDIGGARPPMSLGLTAAARDGPVTAAGERSTLTLRRLGNGDQRSSWNDEEVDTTAATNATNLTKSRFSVNVSVIYALTVFVNIKDNETLNRANGNYRYFALLHQLYCSPKNLGFGKI